MCLLRVRMRRVLVGVRRVFEDLDHTHATEGDGVAVLVHRHGGARSAGPDDGRPPRDPAVVRLLLGGLVRAVRHRRELEPLEDTDGAEALGVGHFLRAHAEGKHVAVGTELHTLARVLVDVAGGVVGQVLCGQPRQLRPLLCPVAAHDRSRGSICPVEDADGAHELRLRLDLQDLLVRELVRIHRRIHRERNLPVPGPDAGQAKGDRVALIVERDRPADVQV
mmetsp:Transcript_14626/g.34667  ORF Transcript_14626/g.34667 Transcript_14626/m.34667 type:complete len:222 (+) Transcript_14626:922-1587(+)